MTTTKFEREVQTSEVAYELDSWFKSVAKLLDDTIFKITQRGPHREALILDFLSQNARSISENEVDEEGLLYNPICFILAALARHLKLTIKPEHWKAAVENVVTLSQQLPLSRSKSLGMYLGTPASIFRGALCESLGNAGLLLRPTILNEENRKLALGLSINWCLRFLLAYALEADKCNSGGEDVRDLAWIRSKLQSLMSH